MKLISFVDLLGQDIYINPDLIEAVVDTGSDSKPMTKIFCSGAEEAYTVKGKATDVVSQLTNIK